MSLFIAIRSFIIKNTKKSVPDLKEINQRIEKTLEEAIIDDAVIVLTKAGNDETFDHLIFL